MLESGYLGTYMNLKPTKGLDDQVWFGLRMQY